MGKAEKTVPTPLKKAIRAFWHANKQFREAQEAKQEPRVVAFYQKQIEAQESLIIQFRQQTVTLVLTDENGDCYERDEFIDLAGIEVLRELGIIHECISCEEREDVVSCYNGDHREFHLSHHHNENCINKALHAYDPIRWPKSLLEQDEAFQACEECNCRNETQVE